MAVFRQERKLDFPDHTADDFDPSVVVTHNDIDYSWNGYGWEVVCKGGITTPDTSIYVTHDEFAADQDRQDDEVIALNIKFAEDQNLQDVEIEKLKDEYLPLAGGNMEGSIQFNPKPYNGLSVFGSDGKDYNNQTKIVFRAENGGTYTDPQVIVGVEPTLENHATTKRYVDAKEAALEVEIEDLKKDQERQDVEIENLKQGAKPVGSISPHVLRFLDSSTMMEEDGGDFYINSKSLLYNKTAVGRKIPELRKGDEFRVISENGNVLALRVTAATSASAFWNCDIEYLTQMTLRNTVFYDVNFIYY